MHMVVQRGNCRRVGGGGRGGGSGEGVKVEKRKFTEQASCHNKVWLQQGMWHRCTQRSTQYRMPNKATPVKFMHVRKICQEHNKIVSFTEIQQVLKKKTMADSSHKSKNTSESYFDNQTNKIGQRTHAGECALNS